MKLIIIYDLHSVVMIVEGVSKVFSRLSADIPRQTL